MRLFGRAKPLKGGNLVLGHGAHRHHTGTHYMVTQDHRAGTALGHSASELRATQAKLIAQDE